MENAVKNEEDWRILYDVMIMVIDLNNRRRRIIDYARSFPSYLFDDWAEHLMKKHRIKRAVYHVYQRIKSKKIALKQS